MAQMYLLSESKPDHNKPHMLFAHSEDMVAYLAAHNNQTWAVDTVQVYEPQTLLTSAERKARREELSKSALPVPLSRP